MLVGILSDLLIVIYITVKIPFISEEQIKNRDDLMI